jgi:hypothetical protein
MPDMDLYSIECEDGYERGRAPGAQHLVEPTQQIQEPLPEREPCRRFAHGSVQRDRARMAAAEILAGQNRLHRQCAQVSDRNDLEADEERSVA